MHTALSRLDQLTPQRRGPLDDIEKNELVIFDFDGTLIEIDGLRFLILCFAVFLPFRSIAALAKLVSSDRRNKSEVIIPILLKGLSEKMVERIIKPYIWLCRLKKRPILEDLLVSARNSGRPVLIATASPVFAVRGIFENVPVLGYDLISKEGRYTGLAANRQPFGHRKSEQISAYAAAIGLSIGECYTDSCTDIPMLLLAKRAFLVGKDGKPRPWIKQEVEIRREQCC